MSNVTRKNWMRRWRRALRGQGYVEHEVTMPVSQNYMEREAPKAFKKKLFLKDDGRRPVLDSKGNVKVILKGKASA